MESWWETQKKKPTTRGKRGETGRPPDGLTAAPSGTQQSARSQGLCQTVSVKVWPSSSQLTNCTQTITTNHLGPDEWNAAINRPRFLISGNTTPPCDEDKKICRLSNQRLWSNNRLPPLRLSVPSRGGFWNVSRLWRRAADWGHQLSHRIVTTFVFFC